MKKSTSLQWSDDDEWEVEADIQAQISYSSYAWKRLWSSTADAAPKFEKAVKIVSRLPEEWVRRFYGYDLLTIYMTNGNACKIGPHITKSCFLKW